MSRRLIGPAMMTTAMLALLIGLGVWQLHRLAWKRAILAAIDRAEASAPEPLPAAPAPFRKVSVAGRFAPPGLLFGADVRDTAQGPVLGGDLIQPLFRQSGPPVLVDRGWVPDRPTLPIEADTTPTRIVGYIRAPEHPGRFSATDDAAARRFYTLDPAAMGAALGLAQVAPYTLVALAAGPPAGPPMAATSMPRPPNDHLSYAITWFGLAVVLAAIFLIWARRAVPREREPHGRL